MKRRMIKMQSLFLLAIMSMHALGGSAASAEEIIDTTGYEVAADEYAQSIVEFAAEDNVRQYIIEGDTEESTIPCSDKLLHASLSSGLIQINNVVFRILKRDKEGYVRPTISEFCDATGMSVSSQDNDNTAPLDLTQPHLDIFYRIYYNGTDSEYLKLSSQHDTQEQIENQPVGERLIDGFNNDYENKDDITIWYPGGINNRGYLSDGTKCSATLFWNYYEAQQYIDISGPDYEVVGPAEYSVFDTIESVNLKAAYEGNDILEIETHF